ncbi:MAG: CAP domain-containing protein [Candidatus Dojkabacteria bacterium]|nr:CAP domain-containing protein [Candidatus Dojkabacteria bacterium]
MRSKVYKQKFTTTIIVLCCIFVVTVNNILVVNVSAQHNTDIINYQNLLDSHNNIRQTYGLSKLKMNSKLNLSAKLKAEAMMITNCWSHYCPDNKSPWEFFIQSGYDYTIAGENLAEGFYKITDMFKAWLNSKSHKENIINNKFTEIGFGITYGNFQNKQNNILVVVHFGNRKDYNSNIEKQKIKIITPSNHEVFTTSNINITGEIHEDIQKVRIYNNNEYKGDAKISNGTFTFSENLTEGNNLITIKGYDDTNTILTTSEILVEYIPILQNYTNFKSASSNNSILQIQVSKDIKNLINFICIAILVLIILIDLIFLNRTNILKNNSLMQYHFSIFVIICFVLILGGTGGRII